MKNEAFDDAMSQIHVGLKVGWLTVVDKYSLVNRRHLVTLQCRCGRKKKLQASQVLLGRNVTCGNPECTRKYREEHPRKGKEKSIIGEYEPGQFANLSSAPRGIK